MGIRVDTPHTGFQNAGGGGFTDVVEAVDAQFQTFSIPAFGSWLMGSDSYVTNWDGSTLTVDPSVSARTSPAQFDGFLLPTSIQDEWVAKTHPYQWGLVVGLEWDTTFTTVAAQPQMFTMWQVGTTLSRAANQAVKGTVIVGSGPFDRRQIIGGNMLSAMSQLAGTIDVEGSWYTMLTPPIESGSALRISDIDKSSGRIYIGFNHRAASAVTSDTLGGVVGKYAIVPLYPGAT